MSTKVKSDKSTRDHSKDRSKERVDDAKNGHRDHSKESSRKSKIPEKTSKQSSNKLESQSNKERDSSPKKIKDKEGETKDKRHDIDKAVKKSDKTHSSQSKHSSDKNKESNVSNGIQSSANHVTAEKIKSSAALPKQPDVIPQTQIKVQNGKANHAGTSDDEANNYEDDFEDYDEDFEEDVDESKSLTPPLPKKPQPQISSSSRHVDKPMSADSTKTESTVASSDDEVPNIKKRPTTTKSRFDFVRGSITEHQMTGMSKTRHRHREILKLVELDFVSYDLHEIAPVRDYEFYMQNFGKSSRVQVATQTGEDAVERDIQCDEQNVENKWSQHPPTDLHGSGGDVETKTFEQHKLDTEVFNSNRFQKFVVNASFMIMDLLNENLDVEGARYQNKSTTKFSEGFSSLAIPWLAKKCDVLALQFSQGNPNMLLTAMKLTEPQFDALREADTVLCVWNIHTPDLPSIILLCDSSVCCGCFGPDRPSTAFAGQVDGSITAWDLLELNDIHTTITVDKRDIVVQSATYDTACLCASKDFELQSPVVSLLSFASSGKADLSAPGSNDSFQIAALEERGTITIWSVLHSHTSEVSDLDFGLSPGSKLKLIVAATIAPSDSVLRSLFRDSALKKDVITTYAMAQHAQNATHFYVGTDAGYILHARRGEGGRGQQKAYQPELEAFADITSLQCSPFESSVLLAGSSDGYVRIYRSPISKPVLTLQPESMKSTPVVAVHWSCGSPYMFYSLYENKQLAVWDLKHNRHAPVLLEQSKGVCMAGSSRSLEPAAASFDAPLYLALGGSTGEVEVHALPTKHTYSAADGHKLLRLLDTL